MLFNSIEFLLFFPLVFGLYVLTGGWMRRLVLLAASIVFYMAFKPSYVVFLFAIIVIDFSAGLAMERRFLGGHRLWLGVSLVANLSLLFWFKYIDFFIANANAIAGFLPIESRIPQLHLLLPIGLSFHTFQAMAYTFEVYWGRQKAEKDISNFALYVLFFPQLVAGPIERPQNLLEQLRHLKVGTVADCCSGLLLMAAGFFMKSVVADRWQPIVDSIYSFQGVLPPSSAWIALYGFTFQIYGDFAGYSLIAIGSAKFFGVSLMQNFNAPYLSTSIVEFWRRWHISLSTWFRDYLYIPLGGNRRGETRTHLNQFTVFLVSGLWHGANWTFVFWGFLHGSLISLQSAVLGKKKHLLPKFPSVLMWLLTFHLAAFAWIFFRAPSMAEGFRIVRNLVGWEGMPGSAVPIFSAGDLGVAVLTSGGLLAFEALREKKGWRAVNIAPARALWMAFALFLVVFLIGKFNRAQFIYFQF